MKKIFLFSALIYSLLVSGQNYILDPTYGDNGSLVNFNNNVLPQKIYFENNKYYLIGQYNSIICLNYDGTFNNSFGNSGQLNITTTNNLTFKINGSNILNGYFYIYGQTIDPNTSNDIDVFIAKFSLDGVLDSTFGNNGIFIQDFGVSNEEIKDLLFLDDGKIICIGNQTIGNNTQIFVSKHNSNGLFDSSFDINGYKILQVPNVTNFYSNNIFNYQNNILIVGYTQYTEIIEGNSNNHKELFLANIDQNGNLIIGFGSSGYKIKPLTDSLGVIGAIGIGKSKLINETDLFFEEDSAFSFSNQFKNLRKYNFTNDTIETLCFLPFESPYFTIEDNQKIYITGAERCISSGCSRIFALNRKNIDGTIDTSFNNNGNFSYNFSSYNDSRSFTYYIHNDGKIFIAGITGGFAGLLATLRITDSSLFINSNLIRNITIVPNPVENELIIDNQNKENIQEIFIFDVTGKEILALNTGLNKIDVSKLDKGIYIINMIIDNQSYYHKFIKR